MTMKGLGSEDGLCIILSRLESLGTSCKVLWHAVEQSPHWQLFTAVWLEIATLLALKIIIIIYRFLKRHKSLGYRGAGGVSIRRTVGIEKS